VSGSPAGFSVTPEIVTMFTAVSGRDLLAAKSAVARRAKLPRSPGVHRADVHKQIS
jgi:hypothetical protein